MLGDGFDERGVYGIWLRSAVASMGAGFRGDGSDGRADDWGVASRWAIRAGTTLLSVLNAQSAIKKSTRHSRLLAYPNP